MENTTTPVSPSSVGIRYGLAIGLVGVILDLLLKSTGLDFKSPLLSFGLSAAVWIVGITLAHKFYKRNNGGYMTYGQGVVIGLIIGLIYGVLSGVFTYIYVNYLDTNYVASVRDYTEQTLAKFNLPEEAVEKGLADITQEKFSSPLAIGKTIFGGGLGGLVLSLVISAITKHTRPEFE